MRCFVLLTFLLYSTLALYGDEQLADFIDDAFTVNKKLILNSFSELASPLKLTHTCIQGPDSQFKFHNSIDKNSVIGRIIKSGELKVGSISGKTYRKEFSILITSLLDRFSEFGYNVRSVSYKYDTGYDLQYALLNGEIDIIHPDIYVDDILATRVEVLHPICTGVGLELAYYIKKDDSDSSSVYKNMKELIGKTIEDNKRIVVFSEEIRKILTKLYPILDSGYLKLVESPDDSLDYLNSKDKYSAVFVDRTFSEKHILNSNAAILKNYFLLPVEMYTRVENPYISVPKDFNMQIYNKGNSVLRQLVDYAAYKLQKLNTHFTASLDDRTFTLGDCMGNKPTLPSTIKNSGILQRIIYEKKIRVGYITGKSSLISVVLDNFVPNVSGYYYQLESKIFRLVGQFLNINNLSISPYVFNNEQELFDALDNGIIDVTSASMLEGGSINGDERRDRYQYTCSTGAWPFTIVTAKKKNSEETIKSLGALKSYIKSHSDAKIAVANAAMGILINDALGMNIQTTIVADDQEGFDYVKEKVKYAAYIPEYIVSTESTTDLHIIHTDQYVATTMFLRRDSKFIKSTEIGGAIYAFTVILSMCIGAFAFVIVYLLYKHCSTNTVSNPYTIIEENDAHVHDGLESLGDDEDPDYVAPQF